jgi:hypothetical protein
LLCLCQMSHSIVIFNLRNKLLVAIFGRTKEKLIFVDVLIFAKIEKKPISYKPTCI